jgi:4-amino-4-deoxy-L-arabinose transferase-like glycosyltransferase
LGAATALATLIRPTTYYLPLVIIVLLMVNMRRSGLRKAVTATAVFLLPVIVLIGGWQLRNHYEVGSWRYSGIEGINMYGDRAAYVLAYHEGINYRAAGRKLDRQLSASPAARCSPAGCRPAQPSRPGPFYDALYTHGVDVLKSYPLDTVRESTRGLVRETFGPGTDTVGLYLGVETSTPLKVALEAWLLCFYLGFAYGAFLAFRRTNGRKMGHVFALMTAAYVLIISAAPEAYARFRAPVMPIVALYAALGLTTAYRLASVRTPKAGASSRSW